MDKPEDAANIFEEYEEILPTKRKGIITVAYQQGKVSSRFRKKEKFVRLVANFKIHKRTIIFKINVFNFIRKYPGSSATLHFLKNYFKDIKRICKQNSSEFE